MVILQTLMDIVSIIMVSCWNIVPDLVVCVVRMDNVAFGGSTLVA